MTDRVFLWAFALSLGVHLLLLAGDLVSSGWLQLRTPRPSVEVVYETAAVKEDLDVLQARLAKAARDAITNPSLTDQSTRVEVRIPDRSVMAGGAMPQLASDPGAVIDLTNLVDAARGDPVLLSYFSALREQIQRAANRQAWEAGPSQSGLVYVSFVLAPSGAVASVAIVGDRSAPAAALRQIALQIVQGAAPFPPFPPSVGQDSKTIVVPLEFLLGG